MSKRSLYTVIEWHDGAPRILDQTRLPFELTYRRLEDLDAACEAIRTMRVRGAPLIGITAAYALVRHAHQLTADAAGASDTSRAMSEAGARLQGTRPTAVNLEWAVQRVLEACRHEETPEGVTAAALDTARAIHEEQRAADARTASLAASLLEGPEARRVITHCNTGPLATGGLGSALGGVIEAFRRGLVLDVLVDETRPRLQGARLTAWELAQHEVPHRVIADGAAASLLARRDVAAALVGADRIAANGDVANKVGTLGLALACAHFGVPFYVVAPLSTLSPRTPSGDAIPIEERDPAEVLALDGHRIASTGALAENPAFDVTPAALVTAIVTEAGVLRPPYDEAIRDALAGHGA